MQRARGKGKEAKGKRQRERGKEPKCKEQEASSEVKKRGKFDILIGFLSQQIFYHEAFSIN